MTLRLVGSPEPIYAAASMIVTRAARNREPFLARHEARRLYIAYPDCGMSERDIAEHLVKLAIEARSAVGTSP